jgi:Gas vesicle synthesis protein GvpL/GvpF
LAFYLYGFVRSGDLPPDPLPGGIGDRPVAGIAEGELGALVSSIDERVVPRRASLLAHAEVLRQALDRGPVLPLRFGYAMPDEDSVRRELAQRASELTGLLDELQDRVEMNVSALYHEDVLLREVLAENPAIAAAQRRLRGRPAATVHFDRIELGEQVSHAVEAKRAADGAQILGELERLAVGVVPEDPRHERMVVNAAFLIERARVDAFDALVEQVSRERAERMQFKLVGPRPAHSFVPAR